MNRKVISSILKSPLTAFFFVSFLLLNACESESEQRQIKVPTTQKVPSSVNTSVDTTTMVWIEGGEYEMGAAAQSSTNDAQPFHTVQVDGFWMDRTEVTNAQFRAFAEATGYQTVAERPVVWEELKQLLPPGTPKPDDNVLQPGSLVFTPPEVMVPLDDYSRWWSWTIGANWRHPSGPESDIEGMDDHPVVHIAYEDAMAYCEWVGKRLPTEAEFEYAARGGLDQREFAWGDELMPNGEYLANFFQGTFPINNSGADGFLATSPVGSFPANDYGLYDMIGNVWEVCSDFYEVRQFNPALYPDIVSNPVGPNRTIDPTDPYAKKHVSKGGSFLCSQEYCSNYKPSGRQGTSYDSGMSHTGFRCAYSTSK